MNSTAILEKFDAVEITNDSRITGEELDFCTAQQELYAKVLAQHCYSYDVLHQLKTDNKAFMQSVAGDNEYTSHDHTYVRYGCDYIDLGKEDFAQKHIGHIHEKFISIIIDYFKEKYNVSINKPKYEMLLGLEPPEDPEAGHRGFRRLSDWSEEEKEQLFTQKKAYKKAHSAYLNAIINAELDYNAILDHIFLVLNGSTFAERVEQEIKDASRKATSGHRSGPEIKNKKISLDILYPHKGYRDVYEVELNGEGYRAILRALAYFNSDKRQTEIYSGWNRFIGYNKYETDGIFDLHQVGSTKVISFKYYKNGKFEITFDSHTTARQFASEYLYSKGAANDE